MGVIGDMVLLNSGLTYQRISLKIIRNLATRLKHFRQPCPKRDIKQKKNKLGFKGHRITFLAGAPNCQPARGAHKSRAGSVCVHKLYTIPQPTR